MKKLLAAAALVCAAPFAANASSLGFEDPLGAPSNLPTNFGDLFTHEGQDIHHTVDDLLATVSHVNTDGGAHSINSLKILADPAKLTFVYLGGSAGFTNKAFGIGGQEIFNEDTASFGDVMEYEPVAGGILDFQYCTNKGDGETTLQSACIHNDGTSSGNSANLNMAISNIFLTESGTEFAVLFFGDAGSDGDRNDMIVAVAVEAVPLPAAGILLVAALGGMAGLKRRRRS